MVEGFKNTDAGIIPIDWDAPVLSEIADFENGKAHEQFIDDKGDFLVVNSKFISQDGRVAKYSKANLSPLAKGDIAIVMSDIPNGKALAKCFSVDKENRYTLNQRIGCIKPFEEIDNDYLFYKLNRNKYFLAFDSGSGQTNLKKSEILACPVALPPTKAEQTAIATAIKDADKLINHLEKLLTKKRNIKIGAMQELLKPKTGWQTKFIPEIISKNDGIKIGPFGSALKKELLVSKGYKVYGQENVFERDMNVGSRYINKEHFTKLKSCELNSGDFIISMMGTIGKCMIVPNKFEQGIMDSHLIRLRLNFEIIDADYLLHYFSSDALLNQVNTFSVGGIMAGLSSTIVKQISIPIPPKKENQISIAKTLSEMDEEIQQLENRLEKQKMMKQGMMQSLLTGKIRLNK